MIIKGSEKQIITGVQDDLNIVLESFITRGRPDRQDLDQLEYDLTLLEKIDLNNVEDTEEVVNLTELVRRIIQEYRQTTSPIRVNRENKHRLREVGATYNIGLTILLDFYEEYKDKVNDLR